jgi:hypothetical protein
MNFVQLIATLRKFGNYLAGLFPIFVVALNFLTSKLKRVLELPLVAPFWAKLRKNEQAQAVWKYFERFYWRTYSKDRFDLAQAPPETVALLRPVFQWCAALCLLIPLTQFSFYPISIEAFSGFNSTAPSWSVTLWLLSLPWAWAALLAGTAVSNRIAFATTAGMATSLLFICGASRDWANLLFPLSLFYALAYCERSLATETLRSKIASVANSVMVGIAASIPLIALTPIRPLLSALTPFKGPEISIGGGVIVGTVLGLLIRLWARLPHRSEKPLFWRGAPLKMGQVVWTIVILLTGYLVAGIFREGLSQSGGLVLSSVDQTGDNLWPIWYFVGVGILHKLMGSSKVIASATEGFLPKFIVTPVLVLLLVVALALTNFENFVQFLSTTPLQGPMALELMRGTNEVYVLTKPAIWSNASTAMALSWFNWVLMFDLVLVILLAVQRRLSSTALMRMFFLSSFAFLLIWEYLFQLFSFARTPSHSVTVLFFFAIWLLWLMHSVGWSLSSKSSPCWPASGRLAVYSGIALMAILDIHARSACKDFNLMNKLFLEMFRGVIDVGLPYFFLVWTSKRVETMPVKISTLLGVFSLGAITAFAFNALEKLAAAGWNVTQTLHLIEAQRVLLESTGDPGIDLDAPTSFFIIKAINYVALLILLYAITRKRTAATTNGSHTILFVLVAYASGIASFSKALIFLPVLPLALQAAIAPGSVELTFNCNLFQSYLSYWIPALMIGVAQLCPKNNIRNILLMMPLAMAVNGLISWGYADFGTYLRASDAISPAVVAIAGVFVLLVTLAIQQIAPTVPSDEEKSKARLLSPRAVTILVIALELILVPMTIFKCQQLRFTNRQFAVFQHPVSVASTWEESKIISPNPTAVTLTRKPSPGGLSILQFGTVPSNPNGTRELLKTLLAAAAESKNYPNLAVLRIEPWTKYHPDALLCEFSYELTATNGMVAGLSVLIPSTDGKTEFYTLHTTPANIESEQWEMAYTIMRLRDGRKK